MYLENTVPGCRDPARMSPFLIELMRLLADLFSEYFPGKMDTAFDGAQCYIDQIGNFLVFIAFIMEAKRDPESIRQGVNDCQELFHFQAATGRIACGSLFVFRKVPEIKIEDLSGPAFPAIVVNKGIAHDRVQPSLNIRLIRILLSVGQSPAERFL